MKVMGFWPSVPSGSPTTLKLFLRLLFLLSSALDFQGLHLNQQGMDGCSMIPDGVLRVTHLRFSFSHPLPHFVHIPPQQPKTHL